MSYLFLPTLSHASMKAPPKRKGNAKGVAGSRAGSASLNESPSEKEGKYRYLQEQAQPLCASMKAPPKRKGNSERVPIAPRSEEPQ